MNDVDPMSMTLGQIYGLSEYYFDLDPKIPHQTISVYGIQYDRYYGAMLRSNGTKFFTIKMNDNWENNAGEHAPGCGVCNMGPEDFYHENRLGTYWFEEHKEYVRPHP